LISGPASIFICDECVELRNEIIARGPRSSSQSSKPEELPTQRLLERLQANEDTVKGKGNQLQQVVEILRSREVSWGANWCCVGYVAPISVGALQLSAAAMH